MPISSPWKQRRLVLAIGAATVLAGSLHQPAAAQDNPERKAYFGETHIHTSWSVDAWLFGNRVTGRQ